MTEVHRSSVRVICIAVLLLALGSCKTDQTLVLIGGDTVSASDIDRDPLSVLPSGALFIGTIDAEALFRSQMGTQVAGIVLQLLPIGNESNFNATRDVKRLYGGIYAMQGADFVGVLQGQFDIAAIQRAARARAATPSGAALVATQYGGYEIFTVANVGFVPLTAGTIVSGNETGMRRLLDRLRYGRTSATGLPPWMTDMLAQTAPTAPIQGERPAFAMVGDIAGQGVIAATSQQLPFLANLTMTRVLGNFKPPGMNVVGSLSYTDDASAVAGAAGLDQVKRLAYLGSLFNTWGFGGAMPDMRVQTQGRDVSFATELDLSLLNLMLRMIGETLTPQQGGPPPFWGAGS